MSPPLTKYSKLSELSWRKEHPLHENPPQSTLGFLNLLGVRWKIASNKSPPVWRFWLDTLERFLGTAP
jgi:hypothetical protein